MAPERPDGGERLLVRTLDIARATEAALVTTLGAHRAMAPEGEYRTLLDRHLDETREHLRAVQARLDALGGGTGLLDTAGGLVQAIAGQALALSKAPLDIVRGRSAAEKLLDNARDECASEALEIATYDALEALATAVADEDTAELARRHRADEERMLADLRAQIPALARAAEDAAR